VPNLGQNKGEAQKPPKGGLQNHYCCFLAYYIFKIGYIAKAPNLGAFAIKIRLISAYGYSINLQIFLLRLVLLWQSLLLPKR
jgi:hypothetical protein